MDLYKVENIQSRIDENPNIYLSGKLNTDTKFVDFLSNYDSSCLLSFSFSWFDLQNPTPDSMGIEDSELCFNGTIKEFFNNFYKNKKNYYENLHLGDFLRLTHHKNADGNFIIEAKYIAYVGE